MLPAQRSSGNQGSIGDVRFRQGQRPVEARSLRRVGRGQCASRSGCASSTPSSGCPSWGVAMGRASHSNNGYVALSTRCIPHRVAIRPRRVIS